MRAWARGLSSVLLTALLGACSAGAPTRGSARAAEARALPALPALGARYELLHRVRATFADDDVVVLRARMLVTVVERRSDRAELEIVAQLLGDELTVAATDVLRAGLLPDGSLDGGARSRCIDGAFDELVSTRLVDATLGARPSRTNETGILRTELDEGERHVAFTRGEGSSLSAEGALALRAAVIGREVYRGEVAARARFAPSDADLLEGRSRTTLSGEVETARGRRGRLEVVSDTEVHRYDGPPVEAGSCRGGFDGHAVIGALAARAPAIRACYETGLALDPGLSGRLVVELVVQPSGDVTDVVPREAPTEQPELWGSISACVIDVIGGIRLVDGPPEPTTFAAPFQFLPDRS
jgi:hypothetical protein